MRRICTPLLCAALITSSLAHGQQRALTLEVALQTALRQNPLLRAADAEVDATQGSIDQARALPNPTLSAEQEDAQRETRTTTVLLSQPLELGGKRSARLGLARSAQELARAERAARQAEVRAGTTQAFFEALIAQERVKVAEESLTIAASATAAAARRVNAGKVAPNEETRARVAEANARIELRQAQAEHLSAIRALRMTMAVGDGAFTHLDGDARALAPPPTESLTQRLAQAPSLQRAQSQVQRAQAAYELERARRMSDVTLSVGSKRDQALGRNQSVLGVSLPLPLFDRNQGAQLEALRRRDAAEALAQAEQQRLHAEVLQIVDQWQARASEAQALEQEVLPAARSAYDAASRGFELGKFGFLDVLDAQRTWLQARSQYLNALTQTHRAAAELERRLGATAVNSQ